MPKSMPNKCGICKKPIVGHSHNGQPVISGSVCDGCNYGVVIPVRLVGLSKAGIDKLLFNLQKKVFHV